jgi:hypothetical protein
MSVSTTINQNTPELVIPGVGSFCNSFLVTAWWSVPANFSL